MKLRIEIPALGFGGTPRQTITTEILALRETEDSPRRAEYTLQVPNKLKLFDCEVSKLTLEVREDSERLQLRAWTLRDGRESEAGTVAIGVDSVDDTLKYPNPRQLIAHWNWSKGD